MRDRVILIAMVLVMLLTTPLFVTTQPADAWVNCVKRDHYHQDRTIKHDRRYKYQYHGYMWVRWDIKFRQPSGYYKKVDRVNVRCYAVDRASVYPPQDHTKAITPSNLIADPGGLSV
jgi:hypothetical protein